MELTMKRSIQSSLVAIAALVLTFCNSLTNARPSTQSALAPPASAPGVSSADEIIVAPPVIPAQTFKLTDYGAVGDGATVNTAAFTKAIADIQKAGGGTLVVPAGVFVTLPFALTSHMELHLDGGAHIKAPETFADYGMPDPAKATQSEVFQASRALRPLISGDNLTDVAITGDGWIDGSGAIWWIWSDKAARRYPAGRLVYPLRPRLILLRNCHRVHVQGVTLTNAPSYHLVPNRCEDVLIEGIRIVAPSDAPNTDAIDPSGARIIIRNCEIDTGDDNVAFNSPVRDALVENLTCLHGHGISIGSPTVGGVHHIIVRHCTFDGGDNGIRIKSVRGRGGLTDDIHYSDIQMKNVNRPIDINMLYNGNANTKTDVGPRQANGNDVTIKNVTITRAVNAGRILGLPEFPAHSITLSNVSISADSGLFVQDADLVTLKNVTLNIAAGPALQTDNANVVQVK